MDQLLLRKYLRCRGAMVYDKFYGLHEQFRGWKCLICGVRQIESEALKKLRKEMSPGPRTEGLTGGIEHAYL